MLERNPTVTAARPAGQPLPPTGAGKLWRYMCARARWWRAIGWSDERIGRALGVSPATLEMLLEEARP